MSTNTGGTSSALTIEEMGVSSPRKLVLTGSGLPLKGAEWESSSQVTTTWYNGNDTATQQVIGPREEPSTWEGDWKRTMLPRTPAKWTDTDGSEQSVVQPTVLRDAMDALKTGGALLRVTWASDGASDGLKDMTVREGRLVNFKVKPDTIYDIHWTAKFDWLGRGRAKKIPVSTRDDSAASAASAFESSQASLDTAAQATFRTSNYATANSADVHTLGRLESMNAAPLTSLQTFQQSMRQVTAKFNSFLDVTNALVRTPYDTAQAMAATARDAQAQAQTYRSQQGRIPVELLSLKDSVASLLLAHTYYMAVDDAVVQTSRAAAEMALRFAIAKSPQGLRRQTSTQTASSTAGNVLAVHTVRQDDTTLRVSMQYYRSPDYAWLICRANGLPWNQVILTMGALLTIPMLNSNSLRT